MTLSYHKRIALLSVFLSLIIAALAEYSSLTVTLAQTPEPDYSFLNTLKLPWACGETLNLSQDWGGHKATGFALDFVEITAFSERGRVSVRSPMKGIVTENKDAGAGNYGNYVEIAGPDKWSVILAHLKTPSPLAKGSEVNIGDVVGTIGGTGSGGVVHIHVEVLYDKKSPDGPKFDKIVSIYGRPRDNFMHASPYKSFISNNCQTPTFAEGFVKEHVSGKTIRGADVELRNSFGSIAKKTDSSGYFVFTGPNPGPAKLIARMKNVGEGTSDITVVQNASQNPTTIRLLPLCIGTGAPNGTSNTIDLAQATNPCLDPSLPGSQGKDFALIIDSSGSMSGTDPNRLRVAAGKLFVQTLEDQDKITVIDFDDATRVLWPLQLVGTNRALASNSIGSINSVGGTNISSGIAAAFAELNDSKSRPKIGVLLTDGQQDGSSYDAQWQRAFAQKGWPIYTFGLSSGADAALLTSIAEETKGAYTALSTADQLVTLYNNLRIKLNNTKPLAVNMVVLRQGETHTFEVAVPTYARTATFITSWPGSRVDTSLEAPDGTIIDATTQSPGIIRIKDGAYEVFRVSYPLAGQWKAHAQGVELAVGGELVTFQADAALSLYTAYLPLIRTSQQSSQPAVAQPSGIIRLLDELPINGGATSSVLIRIESGDPLVWSIDDVVSTCNISGLPVAMVTPKQSSSEVIRDVTIPETNSAINCLISTTARSKNAKQEDIVLPLSFQFEILPSEPAPPVATPTTTSTPPATETPTPTVTPTTAPVQGPQPSGSIRFLGESDVFADTQRSLKLDFTSSEPTRWNISALSSDCNIAGLPGNIATEPLTKYSVTVDVTIPVDAGQRVCTISSVVSTGGSAYPQTSFSLVLRFDAIAHQVISVPAPIIGNSSSVGVIGGCIDAKGFFDNAEQNLSLCESAFLLPTQWNDRIRDISAVCRPQTKPVTVQLWEHTDFDGAVWAHTFCTPLNTSSVQYLELHISSDNMDGYEDGTFHLSGDGNHNNWVGTDEGVVTGLLFNNVALPKGARILNAQIRLRGFGNNGGATPRIRGFAEDNTAPFVSDGTNRPRTRKATSSYVDWLNTWSFNWQWFHSPDLAPIVTEVTSRTGWVVGNNLGFRIGNPSNSGTNWSSVDYSAGPYIPNSGGSAHSTTLFVAYTEP